MRRIIGYEYDGDNPVIWNHLVDLHEIGKRAGVSDETISGWVQRFLANLSVERPDLAWPVFADTDSPPSRWVH